LAASLALKKRDIFQRLFVLLAHGKITVDEIRQKIESRANGKKVSNKKCYDKNREKNLLNAKQYLEKHRERINVRKREASKKSEGKHFRRVRVLIRYHKIKSDPAHKMMRVARRQVDRIIATLKKPNAKIEHTLELLGCSIKQARLHIEAQFKDGMTWENHGHYWHVDHIKPLAKFDLTKQDDRIAACHYTNLQPLLAIENLKKRDSIAA
jgi:hypothetical protein